jgi:hypothetical protein
VQARICRRRSGSIPTAAFPADDQRQLGVCPSGRTLRASSGMVSGVGLASARVWCGQGLRGSEFPGGVAGSDTA